MTQILAASALCYFGLSPTQRVVALAEFSQSSDGLPTETSSVTTAHPRSLPCVLAKKTHVLHTKLNYTYYTNSSTVSQGGTLNVKKHQTGRVRDSRYWGFAGSRERRNSSHKTRKIRSLLALSSALMIGGISGCSSAAAGADKPTIRMADSYSAAHPFAVHGMTPFISDLEDAGFDVDYFPSGQLGSPRDVTHFVERDAVDIAPANPAYLEDQLPLSSVSDLPDQTDDACVAAKAMMDMLGEGGMLYEEEFKPRGLRPLWFAMIPSYEIVTAKTKVVDPADVKGILLRSSGGAFDITIDTIGAAPVSMPAGETYEAITRGTVEGAALPLVSVTSYSLQDVTGYSTDGLDLGTVGNPYVMSEDSWNELPKSRQDALKSAADKTNQRLCEGVNEERRESKEAMRKAGVEFTEFTDSNREKWVTIMSEVRTTWAESLDGEGKPGTETLEQYEEAIEKYEREP